LLLVESLQVLVLRGKTALGGDIDEKEGFIFVFGKRKG
jgi:hypothetical protein